MTQVQLTDLSMAYPGSDAPVLDRLTLDVPAGRITAILGPSGGGKTTMLKLISGLLAPTGGDIAFDGVSVLPLPAERRGAVMVFQNHLLFPSMTVAENVGFGLRMRGRPRAEIAAQVEAMLAMVRLPGLGPRRPADLSGGQQQRVALARALVVRPRVLLLDEPLSNLDAHLRADMRDLILQVQRDLGLTTIFVTHDQEEAAVMADHVALVLAGRLRHVGPPDAPYRRPADAEVARFFGGRNFVAGRSDGAVFHGALGPLALPAGCTAGPGTLTFRPEAVRPGAAPVNTLTGCVTERRFLGTQTRLVLRIGSETVEAALPPDQAEGIAPGDALTVNLPPSALWVMP